MENSSQLVWFRNKELLTDQAHQVYPALWHSVVVTEAQVVDLRQSIRKYYHKSHNTYNSNRCAINPVFINEQVLNAMCFSWYCNSMHAVYTQLCSSGYYLVGNASSLQQSPRGLLLPRIKQLST